jgi:hypothetical protein
MAIGIGNGLVIFKYHMKYDRSVLFILMMGMVHPVRGIPVDFNMAIVIQIPDADMCFQKIRAFMLIVKTDLLDFKTLPLGGLKVFLIEILVLPDGMKKIFLKIHGEKTV